MRLKLVDTSVWIDHFRRPNPDLSEALERIEVLAHPFVIAELALGSLRKRHIVLAELASLPIPIVASTADVLRFIETRRLWGTGLGYVDAHLLASLLLTPDAVLWTRDRKLQDAAAKLNVIYLPDR